MQPPRPDPPRTRAPGADRAPPRRGLHQPEHPPGLLHPINGANTSARARQGVFRLDGLLPGAGCGSGSRSGVRAVLRHPHRQRGGGTDHADRLAPGGGRQRLGCRRQRRSDRGSAGAHRLRPDAAGARLRRERPARGRATMRSEGEFELRGLLPDTPIAVQAELDGCRSDVVTIKASRRAWPSEGSSCVCAEELPWDF